MPCSQDPASAGHLVAPDGRSGRILLERFGLFGRSRRAEAEAGFSLVEVAVAVSLLGVLAVSALLTLIPLTRQARVNREVEAASATARDILEKVQSTPYNEITTLYPDQQVITLATLEDGEMSVSYPDPEADPLEMQLTLTWVSPDLGPMTQTFVTVKTE